MTFVTFGPSDSRSIGRHPIMFVVIVAALTVPLIVLSARRLALALGRRLTPIANPD